MKFAFPLIKLIAGIAVTDCRVDLIQICSFPIHSVILYGIYIRLGLRRIQLNIRKCIEYSANAPPTHSFNLLYILFCVFANIHQQRCFEVYWGVKMAYFLAYYFWLISTTSSLRPLSPQRRHTHTHNTYCGENPVFIRVLYAYIGIRVRVVFCYLIDVLHCGQINVHTVIDCAARWVYRFSIGDKHIYFFGFGRILEGSHKKQ